MMKKAAFALFLFVILSAGLGARSGFLPPRVIAVAGPAVVSVKGVQTARPGSLVVLDPDEISDCRTVWNLNYPDEFSEFYAEDNGKLFLAMPSDTDVCFSLFVVPNDQTQALKIIRYILKRESNNDAPSPVARFQKSDFLVLIEESAARPAEVAKLVNSVFWQNELEAKGYNPPVIHDRDSEQGRAFIESAKAFKTLADVPFLAIMSESGDFLESFKVPNVDELKTGLGL